MSVLVDRFLSWLQPDPPSYVVVTTWTRQGASRDRALAGKARRRARRAP